MKNGLNGWAYRVFCPKWKVWKAVRNAGQIWRGGRGSSRSRGVMENRNKGPG
jgi:hypothetical protein